MDIFWTRHPQDANAGVPVLILFFNITIYGPKHHILAAVEPAWEQIEATFGSKFWPLYLANSGLPTKITVLRLSKVLNLFL